MKVNHSDITFLADRIDTFIDLVSDPKDYFKRHQDAILPESLDLKITAAALYFMVDCYLRGKGLKNHPRSKTLEQAVEGLSDIWAFINNEVDERPYLYPKLHGAMSRGQAAVEIEWLIDGYSKWSEQDEIN
jgi:hypothetical protein